MTFFLTTLPLRLSAVILIVPRWRRPACGFSPCALSASATYRLAAIQLAPEFELAVE